jgi:Fe2+ or Zn2+ uptake regulation protein
MYYVQQGNPEFGCIAKANVRKREGESFYLYSCDTEHNHLVSEAAIKAEEYKQRMAELVKKDPAAPAGEAIKSVKMDIVEELIHKLFHHFCLHKFPCHTT